MYKLFIVRIMFSVEDITVDRVAPVKIKINIYIYNWFKLCTRFFFFLVGIFIYSVAWTIWFRRLTSIHVDCMRWIETKYYACVSVKHTFLWWEFFLSFFFVLFCNTLMPDAYFMCFFCNYLIEWFVMSL